MHVVLKQHGFEAKDYKDVFGGHVVYHHPNGDRVNVQYGTWAPRGTSSLTPTVHSGDFFIRKSGEKKWNKGGHGSWALDATLMSLGH
jgi:hypothetical protein